MQETQIFYYFENPMNEQTVHSIRSPFTHTPCIYMLLEKKNDKDN